ncbi:ketoacyl-ACP synthase III [Streptomyces sp. NBC_00873]|uniref:3-oxoacyl-ACP synthase III family protein n=1 Tax=unclassified Streptomyces TaxID=2593676 RepID=UPI00386ADCD9|nr:ketoacyl-ACP synthase III [Streptomyces sp. NBC_00873]WSY96690.1 ketoacyl-ACP synthase III [Streptomyces sp. NBC_00873]WTA41536.1 ketoacyl-ACP synthase III [Streptomyces sp. NBC_00842]WTA48360.1 ketoacyl-ACP synthase III [Streptomyces sp. NBC_00842]
MSDVRILGTGAYVPDRVVSNNEAGAAAGVDDAWITGKTGIRERRWAADHQATSDLATAAAHAALESAGITADQLSVIVVATSTPDRPQPPTAAYVQQRLGAIGAAAFDVNAVCSGWVFALSAAEGVLARQRGHALVIGADLYSRILNRADRKTVVLFGDGAGALVLGPGGEGSRVRHVALHTFGELSRLIEVPAGGSRLPLDQDALEAGLQYFAMDGQGVRRFVADHLPQLAKQFLQEAGVVPDDISHFVPHQANGVMLDAVFAELALPRATLHRTLTHYANTGAASIPITLDAAARTSAFRPGDLILLAGFGGGMAAGFALVEW